jgi:guanylate kinase
LDFENLGVKDNISQTISKEMKDEAKKEFGENYKKEVTSILNDMLQESNIEDSEYFKNNNDTGSFLDAYLFMKETFDLLFNTPSIKPTSNQGVKSIRRSKFKKKLNNEEIIGSHLYKGNLYGFEKKEFNKLLDSTTQYIFDICDLETAMKVREKNQDLVEIIGIFPSLSFAGVGLEKRIETYKIREHTQKNLVNETKNRLNQIIEDSKFIEENHNQFDFILDKDTIVENRNMMLDYLSKD